jgi:hypothetical protein
MNMGFRVARRAVLATACIVLVARSVRGQIRPDPSSLASAPTELRDQLRADPFTYFRFINRAWVARVCEDLTDVRHVPIVRLHGDAHVEQFAVTRDEWGLDDFDDSARGPQFVDIARFLGSIDLVTRQRGWTRDRDKLWDRFFGGYRRALSDPAYRSPEPDVVRQLRAQASDTRAGFLAWGETLMQPMEDAASKSVVAAMAAFERFMRRERPDLASGYFAVTRAGWLRLGVGSAVVRKVLIRVQGPTAASEDDVLLEAKEAVNLDGLGCVEGRTTPRAERIIDGTRQLGRLRHEILAVGPPLLIPAAGDRSQHLLEWWVSSWEPSYRELRLSDLRSVEDLADIAFDSGVQLGAGELHDSAARKAALSSLAQLEGRLRKETSSLVEELLAGWRELRRR